MEPQIHLDRESTDAQFLESISPVINGQLYRIPAPKLSSQERKRRRLGFRNENNLYKRKSSLSGESMISFFHEDSPLVVYTHDEWWGGNWDPLSYGVEYDFSRGFFDQFYDLQLRVPRAPLVNNKSENSPYCNFADGNKNCHLITSANWNQDSFYSFCLVSCRDVMDCTWCLNCELVYECSDCRGCYNLRFGQHCMNSSDSAFLYDCVGTKNSLFCIGLRNAEYQIFNKPVTQEEFQKTYEYYFSGSYARLEEAKKLFETFFMRFFPVRKEFHISSENVTGNNIWNSTNVHDGQDIYDSQDCAYLHDGLNAKDCHDVCFFDGSELCYESTSLIGYGYRFTNFCRDSSNLFYSDSCYNCKDCFGCVGLRNKQFCIFNKQYTQDEYHTLMARIIQAMSQAGEWGEFFPLTHGLFAYNETLAQAYFPMEKSDALQRGWKWRDAQEMTSDLVAPAIPDSIQDTPSSFCDQVLVCEESKRPYKIISQEFKFYQKMNLPLPRLAPQQRQRNRTERRIVKE